MISAITLNERQKLCLNKSLVISCIVPTKNEQAGIKNFVATLVTTLENLTHNYEIIVVDDGSKDLTVETIAELCQTNSNLKLLELSRNFGKELALSAGLEHCRGDIAFLIDSDFQHPLAMLPTFLDYWQQGYDMVYGIRNDRSDESKLKQYFTQCFYKLMGSITKINITAHAGDFRLLDRKVIDAINTFQERERFMKGLYAWVGFNKLGLPFDPPPRAAGKSAWRFKNLAELALTGITSFSDVPLRIWGLIGLIIASLSFLCALYIITATLIYGSDLPGYPSIMVTVMFFGGVQLLSIGVLGEYIARIFHEVKQRPKYIIKRKLGW